MIGWRYYNHAVVPTTPPHQNPDLISIENKSVWETGALFARWTTDFDCGFETNWWYVIKDTKFDISKLNAKRRYEINKGVKNFRVEKINASHYKEDLYNVQVAALSAYPEKNRPAVDRDFFFSDVETWEGQFEVFASFHRETNEMTGYALLSPADAGCMNFYVLKTKPEHERLSVNAALVAGILSYYDDFLSSGGYICDGERNINHQTAFQNYLEKYFCFRKAYCRLHIKYNPKVCWLFKLLFWFRKLLKPLDRIGVIHQVNAVMKMEEIARKNK